jgi:hypothetical protein
MVEFREALKTNIDAVKEVKEELVSLWESNSGN